MSRGTAAAAAAAAAVAAVAVPAPTAATAPPACVLQRCVKPHKIHVCCRCCSFFVQSKNVDLMVTKDFGRTVNRLVYRGNKFLLSNGYFFVAKVRDAVKQTVTLLVSTDGGKTFAVRQVQKQFKKEKSACVLMLQI